MEEYRVTVKYWGADVFGYRQTHKTVEYVQANSEAMACLKVGSEFWADDDLTHISEVSATRSQI